MPSKNDPDKLSDLPHERKEPRPDFSKPLPPEKLPDDLQKIVDRQDSLYEQLYEGTAPDSTSSSVRYAAYATRIRTLLLSAQRYVAYTSDIGESFRPVAHPYLVKGAYGVSWAYLVGDVANEGYKAYVRNQRMVQEQHDASSAPATEKDGKLGGGSHSTALSLAKDAAKEAGKQISPPLGNPPPIPALEDYRVVMAQRALFQGVASMGLPAFTIHSIVRYSGRALKDAKNTRIRTYGPIGLGLLAVPFLPFVFDEPVENAVEWTFHKAFSVIGGPEAVGHRPTTGRAHPLDVERPKAKKGEKEKEL
ncbi:MAG: hypothetical protein M1817_006170 [Caeruleum heppii]|nr:MAG: hypothetical protein M1817_006170 [Caeruleum heppii]